MSVVFRPELPNFNLMMLRWNLGRHREQVEDPGHLETNPRYVNVAVSSSLEGAALADLLGERDTAVWFLRRAPAWGLGLFQICASDDGVARIVVGDRTFEVRRIGTDSLADPPAWMRALTTAWLVRDASMAQRIAAVDLEVPNAPARGVEREEYLRAMTEAFAAFEEDSPDTAVLAQRARDLTRPEALRFLPPLMVERIHGAPIDILLALLADDAAAFSQAVEAAIAGHAAYVSEDGRTHQHDLLLPWLVLGLAAKGSDRGWTAPIDSGYYPEWMVTGRPD